MFVRRIVSAMRSQTNIHSTHLLMKPALSTIRRRIFNRYTIVTLLIVLIAVFGYRAWHKAYGKKDARETYQTVKVERGGIEDVVTATGTVQPLEFVDVGAQVSGQLKKLHIEVGSIVKEGDLLAEIDPTVFLANVDARRANLRNQQATMKDRQSQLTLAELQYQRQKNLMAADATTRESLQTAEATLRSAKAQIEALQAQIEQTQSSLRADEATLNYAKIYAPMSGTVVSLTARQGQTLNANQSAPIILRIADLSTMTVQAQVSEAEVGKLTKGMDVYFTTLGSQGRRWYGALRKVEPTPTVTNNVVLYNALFDVANRNLSLLPNMTTQVFFIAATAKDALLVPTAAVTLSRGTGRKGGGKQTHAPQSTDATTKSVPTDDALAGLSQEERRAALEKMTPEQRAAYRERRKAARELGRNGDSGKGTSKQESKASPAKQSASADDAKKADAEPATADADAQSGGFTDQNNAHRSRQGTVKVVDSDGQIEQRKVEVGVTNRVQMQVLSGLKEGDEVIVGLKAPPPTARTQNTRSPGGLGQQPTRGMR